jgi:2-haloacid dehalogenase
MAFSQFRVLSFDCYGTIIDWEAGILDALRSLATKAEKSDDQTLTAFAEAESAEESANPALPYSQILTRVHARLARGWGLASTPAEDAVFGGSVGRWPPFPDSIAALNRLKQRAKLVILSNVDRASFDLTNQKLGRPFAAVHTAQDIGSYKPDQRNFDYLIRKVHEEFGVGPDGLLHVAQSLYHDHLPAKAAGLTTAWIDRRQGRGGGATKEIAQAPKVDYTFPSLAAFAQAFDTDR